MKTLGIGGAPATGKTSLMRELLSAIPGDWRPFKYKTVKGRLYTAAKIAVIGIYDKSLFSGTDRLSMAVAPDFKNWVGEIQKNHPGMKIVFEGDRLFSKTIIEALKPLSSDYKFIILDADEETRKVRKADRGDTQNETFIKGRITKNNRIQEEGLAEVRKNESLSDQTAILSELKTFLELRN